MLDNTVFTPERIQAKNTPAVGQPDQYRATMMIATTSNPAISKSARSSFLDRGTASVSIGDMSQTPCTRLLPGPAALGEDQPVTVRGAAKQASLFERIGALCAGRHFARILKGVCRHSVPAATGGRGFLLHDHMIPTKTCCPTRTY
jgi:hypothetical protein